MESNEKKKRVKCGVNGRQNLAVAQDITLSVGQLNTNNERLRYLPKGISLVPINSINRCL